MEIEAVDPAQDAGLRGGGTPRLRLQCAYDPGGNVQALWDKYGKEGAAEAWTYTYDFLDRLTGASGSYATAYQYTPIGSMTSKTEEGTTYAMAYADPNHVHAPSLVNGQFLQYDLNGNMTLRVVDGVTRTQTWDYENRPVRVVSGTLTIMFTYDSDGALVKKEAGGETTHYPGQHYEKNITSGEATLYYYFAGQRIAMPQDDVLYFIVGDHLGTTSLVFDASGSLHSQSAHSEASRSAAEWATRTEPVPPDNCAASPKRSRVGYPYGTGPCSPRQSLSVHLRLTCPSRLGG